MAPFVEDLASIIRFHRAKSGLTQRGLAQVAGVGKTVIFDIEHAKPTVQVATLLRVLNALNIHLTLQSPLMHAWQAQREVP